MCELKLDQPCRWILRCLRGSRDFPHFKVQDVLTIVGANGSNLFAGFDALAFLEADAFQIAVYRSKSTVGKDDGFSGSRDWKHTRHIPSEYGKHRTRSFVLMSTPLFSNVIPGRWGGTVSQIYR